ncbi:hypothetical protein CIHG_00456 [Coccidioides immitis H538.4]|uniref:Uncharacterized protein n=1 Tax=Coccidioides immitis H538.4 TaxID=396776 RepID=A0A0J8RBV6_COCIT|nr:hypothetical protein CIHG_00456 [Coccidioides immitis H538.4]
MGSSRGATRERTEDLVPQQINILSGREGVGRGTGTFSSSGVEADEGAFSSHRLSRPQVAGINGDQCIPGCKPDMISKVIGGESACDLKTWQKMRDRIFPIRRGRLKDMPFLLCTLNWQDREELDEWTKIADPLPPGE